MAAGLVLLVAGCSRPGALTPVSVSGTETVDILAATTRAPSDEPGVVFSGERGSTLSFANLVISVPPNRQVGTVQWPTQAEGDPTRDFVATSVTPLARGEVLPWLRGTGLRKRRVLVFVHGFNTRFDAAVFRFAQIVHDSSISRDIAPVLFSWPSRGRVTDYNYDRESNNFSRSDLAYMLTEAARSPYVQDVTILAHSMGSWVTVEALREISLRNNGRIPPKIDNVILASPDLDVDVFRRQVMEIGPNRPHFTIFVSRNDRALRLSRAISGNVDRVGGVDLSRPDIQAQLEKAQGVTVVDLSALNEGDALAHSKFATSPQVVQLLGAQVLEGPGLGGKSYGVAEGASEAVGSLGAAVGNVVAAPILVFTGGRY